MQADEDRRLQLLASTDALVQESNDEDARHMRAPCRAKAYTVVSMLSGDVRTFWGFLKWSLGGSVLLRSRLMKEGAEDDEDRTGDGLLDVEIDAGNVVVDVLQR